LFFQFENKNKMQEEGSMENFGLYRRHLIGIVYTCPSPGIATPKKFCHICGKDKGYVSRVALPFEIYHMDDDIPRLAKLQQEEDARQEKAATPLENFFRLWWKVKSDGCYCRSCQIKLKVGDKYLNSDLLGERHFQDFHTHDEIYEIDSEDESE